jgi:hypothetical protein
VIREINETLSLTNEPQKLINTALDTLSQVLNIECCWIQTIRDRKNQLLSLAADRGFSDKMRSEVASMDLTHDFCGQIIGAGHKIIIPDLNNDGAYGLPSFRAAGYKWLVAVPLMTYRAWGLLGTASKNKKLLEKDTADLIMVIAGLIANALSKAHLSGSSNRRGKQPEVLCLPPDKMTLLSDTTTITAPVTPPVFSSPTLPPGTPKEEDHLVITVEKKASLEKKPQKPVDPVFHSHTRKMETFRKTHQ